MTSTTSTTSITSFGALVAFTSGVLIASGTVLMTSDEPVVSLTNGDDADNTTSFFNRVPREMLPKRLLMKTMGLGSFFLGSYLFAPTFLRQAWLYNVKDISFYVKLGLG